MISTKPKVNPDGTYKTEFNPADFATSNDTTSINIANYANLFQDNVFNAANNTFNNITATGTVTSTNITTLTSNVSTLTSNNTILTNKVAVIEGYSDVLLLTATSTTVSVSTTLPNVLFCNISASNKTVFLPTLSSSYPNNYNGRTFVVHCHDGNTSSGNTLTIKAASNSQYINSSGATVATGRILSAGSFQRYYTFNGLYYEI